MTLAQMDQTLDRETLDREMICILQAVVGQKSPGQIGLI